MYALRYYQQRAVSAVQFAWSGGIKDPLLRLGTGGGKTAIAAELVRDAVEQGQRILFCADQNELAEQPRAAFWRHAQIRAATEKAGDRASLSAEVVIATTQTISKKNRLERFPQDHFQVIIADECHRNSTREKGIRDYFHGAKSLGLTATPFRADMATLKRFYSEVVFDMPMKDLEREGFAPVVMQETFPVEIDLEKLSENIKGEDYEAEALDSTIAPYFHAIAQVLNDHYSHRHVLVFLPLIRSSQAFAKICNEYSNLHALHVDGNSDRGRIYAQVEAGGCNVLCNAGVVSTGVDIPILDTFLNLRLTRSRAWYQQAFGRTCRVLPSVIDDIPEEDQAEERRARIAQSAKPSTLCLDLLLQHDHLGVMHPGHLVADSEEEAEAISEAARKSSSPQQLLAIQKAVQEKREAQLAEALDQKAGQAFARRLISADKIAAILGRKDIEAYRPRDHWQCGHPTQPQANCLRKFGIDPETVTSKGMANLLIGVAIFRSRSGLATFPQLCRLYEAGPEWLKRHGIARLELLRKKEASALVGFRFEELRARRKRELASA